MTPDPIGLEGGINLWPYTGNNPVNWIDPWGLRIQIMGNPQERQYVLDQLKKFIRGELSIDKNGILSRSRCKGDESIEADVDELIASERLYRIFSHLYERGWDRSQTVPTNVGADIYFDPNVDATYQCAGEHTGSTYGVKSLFLTRSCHFGKLPVDGEATPNPV